MAKTVTPVAPAAPAAPEVAPAAPAAPVVKKLVLGSKAPKHRTAHTATAWAAITKKLPATAAELAALPELKVPECGGPKGNGLLYVSYAVRRGWLAEQA
jgi:hypothetical protein